MESTRSKNAMILFIYVDFLFLTFPRCKHGEDVTYALYCNPINIRVPLISRVCLSCFPAILSPISMRPKFTKLNGLNIYYLQD